ncbi:MAG: hypothetical protein EZS28_012267 [Streblomastix strix]|uniref:Major facilitator superfamily (MFS) profile domain-containing protein n=1 Tax=Streblomastix strix TaxID=222440 RepID=A0A5J4WB92_9EUKA|nr:MAG: hypothetical protein EZS28_012267 [Streblomastix strix]
MIIFLVVCGLQSGVSQAWNGNITYLLTEIGINETIGGIGSFFAIVLAAVGGILSSFIVQRILIRKEKLIVGILYIIQDILMVFAVLMLPFPGEISSINGEENINHKVIIQAPTAILVILTILAGSFGGTPFPLYFEMVAELGFPHVSESISAGALAFLFISSDFI